VGACTGGQKGAGLSDCKASPHGKPRDLRSVGRAVGAIPRSFPHLRSDPSTLAARQPDPFAGIRKRRQPWPTQAWWSRSSRSMAYLGGGDIGCSSTRIEEGSTESPAARSARDRSRALHSALLGPCCSEKQFPELLPFTEAVRHQAHGPRLERGDAPARGTRRGSTEGMAPWRHLTAGVKPGRARPGRGRSPLSHQTGRTRKGWRHPKRENEVARSPVSSRTGANPSRAIQAAQAVSGRDRQRSCW
jgi:hypothetical protein